MKHPLAVLLAWLIISHAAVMGARATQMAEAPTYWPTHAWRTSTPEAQGMDSRLLADAVGFIMEQDCRLHSMLVIRNGYIVADAYFYPFAPGQAHDIASATKSVTSTLVGIAIDKGRIKSVDQPALDFFPDRTVANLDDRKRAITLESLLTMTSGLDCSSERGEITLLQMRASPDWVQFMLDLPMSAQPGTRFVYCSGGVHLLSAIIRKATGMSALAFGLQHLFRPLGISHVGWPFDPQGADNHGWGDMRLTPHDMAKLGYLYLNGGRWEGRQLLSRKWITAATSRHVSSGTNGYGYLWWIRPSGSYRAAGRGGQQIVVLPGQNMVVVLTGGGEYPFERLLTSFIIPAAKSTSPLPANPKAMALLESSIRRAALPRAEERKPAPALPETAKKVSGQTYILNTNPFGLLAVSLAFAERDQAMLRLYLSELASDETSRDLALAVGLDNVFRKSPGRFGLPAAAKGFWEAENVFVVDFDEIGNINHWRITMTFEDERALVLMHDETGLGEVQLVGRVKK